MFYNKKIIYSKNNLKIKPKFMKRAFLPPRTLMTGILGGGRSIHLSYGNIALIISHIVKKCKNKFIAVL